MKYRVVGTDILHDGKLYREGSEIELTDKAARPLKAFLKPLKGKKKGGSGSKTDGPTDPPPDGSKDK